MLLMIIWLFQSTHPRRVWPRGSINSRVSLLFQSTHPRRVWLLIPYSWCKVKGFNPHTHEGCDFVYHHTKARGWQFQSTHPRRVWPRARINKLIISQSFNPHTHEGCDNSSILPDLTTYCFNPHTHEGCDYSRLKLLNINTLFQSTHPRRVWLLKCIFTRSNVTFQSTHPRRVWLHVLLIRLFLCSFNPHTHEGCDWFSVSYSRWYFSVSIHTPTKGVTWFVCFFAEIARVSIHTPTKGVTNFCFAFCNRFTVSIHTPTKGVTLSPMRLIFLFLFQSTHPRRVWQSTTSRCLIFSMFQSTHPRRVWHLIRSLSGMYKSVSIHTPTKGVTAPLHEEVAKVIVSIHTPTKGVTPNHG